MASNLSKIEVIALIALVLLLVLLGLLGGAIIAQAGLSDNTYGNDFTVFYAAAHSLVNTGDPYHHPLAAQTPYLYLPLFALLITPLTFLSLSQAASVWYGVNLLIILALILTTAKVVGRTRSEQAFITIMLVVIATRVIIDNLFWGQVNILVALLVSSWLWAWQQRQAWWAELLLALAISIKITPALLIFYLVVRREGQTLLRLAISLIILNGVSLIPLGQQAPRLLHAWFQRTILNGEGFSWAYAGNQSLRGAIIRFLTDAPTGASYYPKVAYLHLSNAWATKIFLLIGLTLLLSWLYQAYKFSANKQTNIDLIAAGCCLMLLLSNLSWKAHFIMLMLPWAVLARQTITGASWRCFFAVSLIVTTLLIMIGTVVPVIGLPLQQWFEVHSYYCLLALLTFYLIMKDISYNQTSR